MLLFCLVTATAVAKDETAERIAYVRTIMASQERLAHIAHRLATNATDLCGGAPRYSTGAYLYDWDLTTDEWVDATNDALGINLHLTGIEVLIVVPDSPADRAGLEVGDRIVRLDNWRVPPGRGALLEFNRRLNESIRSGASSVDLRVQHGAHFRTVKITPMPACAYPTVLEDDGELNAYADGEKIVVKRGLLDFITNDDELALVVGHELAHNVLGHHEERLQNVQTGVFVGLVVDVLLAATVGVYTNIGRVIGANVGAHIYTAEQQAEADYLGLYLAARAGFDFERAPAFMVRYFDAISDDASDAGATRTPAERETAFVRYVHEIRAAKNQGRPLVPNLGGRAPP